MQSGPRALTHLGDPKQRRSLQVLGCSHRESIFVAHATIGERICAIWVYLQSDKSQPRLKKNRYGELFCTYTYPAPYPEGCP